MMPLIFTFQNHVEFSNVTDLQDPLHHRTLIHVVLLLELFNLGNYFLFLSNFSNPKI